MMTKHLKIKTPAGTHENTPPEPPVVLRDTGGAPVILGVMQQWIVDVLTKRPRTLDEVAAAIKEDEARTRTRLRHLVTKGVVEISDGDVWKLVDGPVEPRAALPPARRGRKRKDQAKKP
jgi:hypothetical protein